MQQETACRRADAVLENAQDAQKSLDLDFRARELWDGHLQEQGLDLLASASLAVVRPQGAAGGEPAFDPLFCWPGLGRCRSVALRSSNKTTVLKAAVISFEL